MAVHLVNLMVRNTQSKPPKAHFSAIHSLQLVPANIRGTREFAGEITSNKGLGFITLHIFTRFILHFQKTLVEELSEFQLIMECLSWVCSERYSKTLLKPVKCLDGHLRGQAFPTELSQGVCWDEAQGLS